MQSIKENKAKAWNYTLKAARRAESAASGSLHFACREVLRVSKAGYNTVKSSNAVKMTFIALAPGSIFVYRWGKQVGQGLGNFKDSVQRYTNSREYYFKQAQKSEIKAKIEEQNSKIAEMIKSHKSKLKSLTNDKRSQRKELLKEHKNNLAKALAQHKEELADLHKLHGKELDDERKRWGRGIII